jgi:SPOR domain
MYSRYLIVIVMIGFPGFISYGQFDSPLNRKQISIHQDLIIQVGAFRNESYALVLKDKLYAILDKTVIIVTEDGFFKVRIKGFSGEEEMEKFYSTLAFLGMKDFWVLPVKKQEEIAQQIVGQTDSIIKPDSVKTPLPDVGDSTYVLSPPNIVLQIDVFHNKSEALNAQKTITTKLNLTVEIVQVWKYYKVFVTGLRTRDEANKYFIAIAKLGYPKISLIMNYNDIHKPDSLRTVRK